MLDRIEAEIDRLLRLYDAGDKAARCESRKELRTLWGTHQEILVRRTTELVRRSGQDPRACLQVLLSCGLDVNVAASRMEVACAT